MNYKAITLKHFGWLTVSLFMIWLAFNIGLLQATACLFIWLLIWFIYSTLSSFIKPKQVEVAPEPDPDQTEAFYINFRNMLSESETYDLLWLANAITLPIYHNTEHYYYDDRRKEFFYTIASNTNPFHIGVLNKFDLEYSEEISSDIAVRLELINDDSSHIIDIPRLNKEEKVGIQLEFLSFMARNLVGNEMLSAVEGQQDDYGFALDTLLKQHSNTAALLPVWEDFKLKVTFTFISKFTQAIGVELNLLD